MPSSSDSEPSAGTVVGESIPTPMIAGLVAGLIFSILVMICHISITKCLLTARLKHLPRARKVKVKKAKKGKKGGKKGKKGKKDETSASTGTSGATGGTSGSTIAM
ncbi:unnamed protein product [Caenorhabditis sp. 36 PRJEB53466]|nr:unnamed protein product [Caenorhabditis sp. 36 PRJEB53466]